MVKKEKVFQDIAKVYLENEIDNWEWSYKELVHFMVGEFNYGDISHLLEGFDQKQSVKLFEKYLTAEIERFTALDNVATDNLNDKIIKTLQVETKNIKLN